MSQPVRKTMCPTCPFRPNSPYSCLAPDLAKSALTEASRVCHSTGVSVIYGGTGKPEMLCRGTRDIQLKFFHHAGVLAEPTDECWAETWKRMQKR